MGRVYLARSDVGRTVAVKVVQDVYAQHPEFRKRFEREVDAARRVGGDWTAAVLDADTEAAVPWVATQYIPGPDLTTVVARDFGPLPEHSVQTLAEQLSKLVDVNRARCPSSRRAAPKSRTPEGRRSSPRRAWRSSRLRTWRPCPAMCRRRSILRSG